MAKADSPSHHSTVHRQYFGQDSSHHLGSTRLLLGAAANNESTRQECDTPQPNRLRLFPIGKLHLGGVSG